MRGLGDQLAWTSGDVVGRSGNFNQRGVDLTKLQRMIELLGFRQRRSKIRRTDHNEGRCTDVADQRERRELHVAVRVLPWCAGITVVLVAVVVIGHQRLADPVDHRLRDYCRSEPIRLPYNPRRHDATGAATGHEVIAFVDVAPRNHGVHTGHEVVVVLTRVVVIEQIAELLSVARAASGVGVQNHVAGRGIKLDLGGEAIAVV